MKMKIISTTALSALISLGALDVAAQDDERTIMRCKGHTADRMTSMKGVYESRQRRRLREKFKASFETAPGFDLQTGDVLQVKVDDEVVGLLTLEPLISGDIGGEIKFDTKVDQDSPDTTIPFPANWPGVAPGTVVTVGVLGCSLQVR